MSKQKSLSIAQLEEVKQLVLDGTQPQKIAELYNVGISTIHNYKSAFKKEGLVFASVRGRQPASASTTPVSTTRNPALQNQGNRNVQPNVPSTAVAQSNTFIINGTSVNVSGNIKSVDINNTDKGIVFKVTL